MSSPRGRAGCPQSDADVAMDRTPHFRFETQQFEPVVAHDGIGQILSRRVSTADDGRAYDFVDFTIVPPGASIGIHSHAEDNEELYVILSGRAEMTLDGQTLHVAAGDVVVNRAGGCHGLINTGALPVRMVVVQVPVTTRRMVGGD